MARHNNNNQAPQDRKREDQKRDAAGHVLRYSSNSREPRSGERERELKNISMNRFYMNDLYERSSI